MAGTMKHVDGKLKNPETRGPLSDCDALRQNPDVKAHPLLSIHTTLGNQAVRRMVSSGFLQTKLSMGNPNDAFENEADKMAGAIMAMPEPAVQRQPEAEEEELIQPKAISGDIGPKVPPDIESQIHAQSNAGQALPESSRDFFGARFGADFSGVRVHTGASAHQLNTQLNSRAFTTGQNVFFKQGEYNPHTNSGKQLLAHELTHVIQQNGGAVQSEHDESGPELQAKRDVIQRQVETYGGEWDTTDYSPSLATAAVAGDDIGAHIRLTFMPTELTVTDTQNSIGLTQTVRTMCNTAPGGAVNTQSYANARKQSISLTAAEGQEGRAVDQGDSEDPAVANTNPFYAVENTAGNVSRTLTDVGANPDYGQHGHRVRQPDGTFDEQEAILDDTPVRNMDFTGQEWHQQFEATAMVLSGPMANTYLGSVEWGWTVNAAGDNEVDPNPIRVISMGTPTGDFMDAAGKWNNATFRQAGADFDTVDLPMTGHATADPATLDDRQLHTRIRQLTDRILTMRRNPAESVDYQNMRFEARGLAREAHRRGAGVVDSGHTYRVRQGDTLWDIAREQLGSSSRWTAIFALNAAETLDPNLIYPGHELRMPTPYSP